VVRPIAYIHTSKHFIWLHISLIHLIVYKILFILKESEHYKSEISSASTLTIINLIYHLVTFVSWVLVTLISWMLITLMTLSLDSFDCIQDSIYRERVWTLQIWNLFCFYTNNNKSNLSSYNFCLLSACNSCLLNACNSYGIVSWVFITLVSIPSSKPNDWSQTLRFDFEHQRVRKEKERKNKKGYYGLN
jgi:hypothetical protein